MIQWLVWSYDCLVCSWVYEHRIFPSGYPARDWDVQDVQISRLGYGLLHFVIWSSCWFHMVCPMPVWGSVNILTTLQPACTWLQGFWRHLDLCHVLSDTLCGSMTCLEDGHLFATRCNGDGFLCDGFLCDGFFIVYGYCLSLRYCETFRNKPGRSRADRDERGKLKFMREVFFVVLLVRYNLRDMQLVLQQMFSV